MRWFLKGLILVGIFSISRFALANMASTNYQINWDSLNYGGSDTSTSDNYILRDTLGNPGAGESQSASYLLRAGYRAGIFDQVISFEIFAQNNSSKKSVNSLVDKTIGVETDGLSVGDYIVLVQDEGGSQISAIGQISGVGAETITVDSLKNGGVAPLIDDNNDCLYKLGGYSTSLGTLNTSEIKTATIGFEINTDFDSGYSVQIYENHGLQDGTDEIAPVADGAVTAGSEEYGGRSSDVAIADSTFDTEDTAFTADFQKIADDTGVQFASRNFLTLKASINGSTNEGDYSQNLVLIASGNF
jgi:hypothetical protein